MKIELTDKQRAEIADAIEIMWDECYNKVSEETLEALGLYSPDGLNCVLKPETKDASA